MGGLNVWRLGLVAALTAAVCLLAGGLALQAIGTPVQRFDEPLWFMRSQTTPADLSTRGTRYQAIDVPGLNRWTYWLVLTVSRMREVSPAEPHCWRVIGGRIYWQDAVKPQRGVDGRQLRDFERSRGAYAPRRVVEAMRFTNIGVFLVGLGLLYVVALGRSASHALAAAATVPLAVSPLFGLNIAFVTWSGDIFLFAALALVLYLWVRRPAATFGNVLLVGAACGVAISAKQPGILGLAAYCVWAAWQSRRWRRLLWPALACGAAFLVFAVLNPVIFLHPDMNCLQVLSAMSRRRGEMAAVLRWWAPMSTVTMLSQLTPYWALIPLNVVAACRALRDGRDGPLALWSIFLWGGTIAAYLAMGAEQDRYLGPVEYGLFFPTTLLCGMAIMRTLRRGEDGNEGR